MKKFLSIVSMFLLLIFGIAFVGCENNAKPKENTNQTVEQETKEYTDVSQMSVSEQKSLAKKIWDIPPALYDKDQVDNLGKLLKLAQKDIDTCEKEKADADYALDQALKSRPIYVSTDSGWVKKPDPKIVEPAQKRVDKANLALEKAKADWDYYYEYFIIADVGYAYNLLYQKLNVGNATNKLLMSQLAVVELQFTRYVGKSSGSIIQNALVKQIKEISGIDISVYEGTLLD